MIANFLRNYYVHIFVWFMIFTLPFVNYLYEPEKMRDFDPYLLKSHSLNVFFLCSSFYLLSKYVAPKFFFHQRAKFILFTIAGLLCYIAINYLLIVNNPNGDFAKMEREDLVVVRLFVGPSIIYFLCVIIGNMLFFYNEQDRQKELNKQIQLQKTTAELNLLKLQISPHFLFNTLNNIRWQVRKQPLESEDSIFKLSEILRYILYDVGDNKVELHMEIQHIKNFMELQKLRFPVEGRVELSVAPELQNHLIHPLLFIHFIENAFKFGVDSETPPDIYFRFETTPEGIIFQSRNKVLIEASREDNTGIGLSNVKRRLELLYPDKHELVISKENGFFNVSLHITCHGN